MLHDQNSVTSSSTISSTLDNSFEEDIIPAKDLHQQKHPDFQNIKSFLKKIFDILHLPELQSQLNSEMLKNNVDLNNNHYWDEIIKTIENGGKHIYELINNIKIENNKLHLENKKLHLENIESKEMLTLHKREHRLTMMEKNKVYDDLYKLKKHSSSLEALLQELQIKFKTMIKDKAIVMMKRDKAVTQFESLRHCMATAVKLYPKNDTHSFSSSLSSSIDSLPKLSTAPLKHDPPFLKPRWSENNGKNLKKHVSSSLALSQCINVHTGAALDLAVHRGFPLISSVGEDCEWKLVNSTTGNLLKSGPTQEYWLSSVAFNPLDDVFVTASGDGYIKLWSVQAKCTDKEVAYDVNAVGVSLEHRGAIWSVDWDCGGRCVLTAGIDCLVRLCDVERLGSTSTNSYKNVTCKTVLRGHKRSVNSAKFAPNQHILVTASTDRTVALWDARTGICEHRFRKHQAAVNFASFSPDGTQLVSCDAIGVCLLWDLRKSGERNTSVIPSHPNDLKCSVSRALFDPLHRNVIATAQSDGSISIINLNKMTVSTLTGHRKSVNAIVFSPQSGQLFSASKDGTVGIWS